LNFSTRKKLNAYEYSAAIDLYLELTPNHISNQEELAELWERAVTLSMEHERGRATDVILLVAALPVMSLIVIVLP
jgi:hypothetical protein